MPNKKIHSNFYAAIEQAAQSSSVGPVNSTAILQNKNLVLEKASSLLVYQNYLVRARKWKAAQQGISIGFKREVQAQAVQALTDGQALAAATLRMTKHLKLTGHLDRMLDTWISGVRVSGPVPVRDLWSDIENDPNVQQLLKDHGLTDELWTAVTKTMKKVDGRLFLQGGKLAAESKIAGQDQMRSVVFRHSANGMPRTISELLRRGQFELMVEQFSRNAALPLDLDVVAGEVRDLEIADVISVGAIFGVQSLAQHKRKLEDTGLSTYAGGELITALIVASIILFAVGFAFTLVGCPNPDFEDSGNETLCKIGQVLILLAMLTLGAAFIAGAGAAWIAVEGFYGLSLVSAVTSHSRGSNDTVSIFRVGGT
jgi:hypothetical protein